MSRRHQERLAITVRTAVRQTGLSDQIVRECIQRSLVGETLTEADLVELRRIRRLQELGVNLPGIEVILHMRQRIRALQAEMDRLEPWSQVQAWLSLEDLASTLSHGQAQRLLPWDEPWSEKDE
jgi:hypothetical protein